MINRSFIAQISQKKLADREVIEITRFVNYYEKCAIEEMDSKIDCFVGFFHHPVMTTSVIMHVYRYPLFKSGFVNHRCVAIDIELLFEPMVALKSNFITMIIYVLLARLT